LTNAGAAFPFTGRKWTKGVKTEKRLWGEKKGSKETQSLRTTLLKDKTQRWDLKVLKSHLPGRRNVDPGRKGDCTFPDIRSTP